MTAPSFVQVAYGYDSGGTKSFGAATVSGHLLVLAVLANAALDTPSGWTRVADGTYSTARGNCYIYWKQSTGDTSVDLTWTGSGGVNTWGLLEYDLTGPGLEGSVAVNHEASPPGFTTGPSIAYGAGPRVVLGLSFCDGPQGTDSAGVTAPGTLRHAIAGGDHGAGEIYLSDDLIDTTAGSTSWNYSFTDTFPATSFALSFKGGSLPSGSGAILLDLYDQNDGYLTTIFDATAKSFRVELAGTGSGSFTVNRYSTNLPSVLSNAVWCKVRVPQIDTGHIFTFFLETSNATIVSPDEKGGEDLVIGGRGALAYLDWARMWSHSYITKDYPGPPDAITDTGAVIGHDPFGGLWRLYNASTGAKPGQMLGRIIGEARAYHRPQHPVPLLTIDFDYVNDSGGTAWASGTAAAEFSAQIGESVLSVAGRLIGTGVLDVTMSPDFKLQGWNSFGRGNIGGTAFGSAIVRFVKGTNIADTAAHQVRLGILPSYSLVTGENDTFGTATVGSGPVKEVSVPAYGTVPSTLAAVGTADLNAQIAAGSSIAFAVRTPKVGDSVSPTTGIYLPGGTATTNGKYWIGDTVRVHTGTGVQDINEQDLRIYALTLSEQESGDLAVVAEMVSGYGPLTPSGTLTSVSYGGGISAPSGGPGVSSTVGLVVEDEGAALASYANTVNFVGAAVTAAGTAAVKTVTVSAELPIEGGQDTINALGSMGTAATIDPTLGNVVTGTLSAGTCVLTLQAPSGSGAATLELWITQDGTGGRAIMWPGYVTWDGGVAPSPSTTAGVTVRYVLESVDGGTNWIGDLVGGSSVTYATPALTLGTANAAGTAASVIRSDATILAFDATPPADVANVASVGAATTAARRDHVHDLPTSALPDQHVHVVDEQFNGDGTATVFTIANTAAPDSVMAWVSGTRTPVTLGGTSLDQVTFGSAPASGTANVSIDYAAVVS